jgi:hypothetical protein
MSAPALAPAPPLDELAALYDRYKRLALATGATLVLGEPPAPLAGAAAELRGDSLAARDRGEGGPLAGQLEACVTAAGELHDLVAAACAGDVSDEAADRVRASHSRLRHEVWKVMPCEYVPCSGAHRHDHRHER